MWALLLLGVLPHDDTLRESVDVIEVNHFFDEHGRLVFDQLLFWEVKTTPHPLDKTLLSSVYEVRDWRLIKHESQLPQRDQRGGYYVHWMDGEKQRYIHAPSFRETWSQHDPELAERENLPKEKRKPLRMK